MNRKVIIIGASGHGKVLADIVLASNDIVVGFLDDGIKKGTKILDYEVLGKTEDALTFHDCEFLIGIGSNTIREKIASQYQLLWYTAIHPTALIGSNVTIKEGTVLMANTVVNTCSTIGKHCIINTGSIVEHDNTIEDYVHLSPNVTLCGTVSIGTRTHVGAGSTVRNNISICSDCTIGIHGAVVKDITEPGVYVGVPVRRIR